MQKLLITGASGFLGWHLCQLAKQKYTVFGTYHTKAVEISDVTTLKVDLTDFEELKNLFQQIKPDAIIHTAALSQPNYCQEHPEISQLINTTASWNIAGLCADNSLPLVFTSTDFVFDGLNPPYKENDYVCPINIYAEQKVEAEIGILTRHNQATICRMPLMFGRKTPTAKSFIQPFIEILKAGKELNLFVDEIRTPVSANSAAKGLLLALETEENCLHLGGRERISRYEFGRILVEVLKLPADNLKSCLQEDMQMSAPRPKDVSLDSSLAFSLGYQPLSIKEELQQLAIF